jgi:DNA-directed RNA polymerase specialized sigma24 family protein
VSTVERVDHLERYEMETRRLAAANRARHEAADARAAAVAELAEDGWSMARIAAELGMTRANAHKLVKRGREVKGPPF